MSRSSVQRKREANRQARDEKLANHLINGTFTYKSLNLTMEDAFQAVVKRVSWLNDKIAWSQLNGKGFHLYVIERESLLLLADKVRELSERLLSQSKSKEVV